MAKKLQARKRDEEAWTAGSGAGSGGGGKKNKKKQGSKGKKGKKRGGCSRGGVAGGGKARERQGGAATAIAVGCGASGGDRSSVASARVTGEDEEVSEDEEVQEAERQQGREEEECAVCFMPLGTASVLACGHGYHGGCLDQWVEKCQEKGLRPTCPMCRATLPTYQPN